MLSFNYFTGVTIRDDNQDRNGSGALSRASSEEDQGDVQLWLKGVPRTIAGYSCYDSNHAQFSKTKFDSYSNLTSSLIKQICL